jgi:hypothetical protein
MPGATDQKLNSICMYGVITMKFPCIISVCYLKIKLRKKVKFPDSHAKLLSNVIKPFGYCNDR